MAMEKENTGPCGDFMIIIADLESENPAVNVAATDRASALIAEGNIPEPDLACRLISVLASNLEKPGHEPAAKSKFYLTLEAIREAIISNHITLDDSARNKALHTIWCCSMDEDLRCLGDHASMVRMWTVQGQLAAVKMICDVFRLTPENVNDIRCVTTFAALMLSPHTAVVRACEDALLSLPPIIPGFAFAVARAYCHILLAMPPQPPPQMSSFVAMLGRLNQISMSTTEVDRQKFDGLAVNVLDCLANCKLVLQKKVLTLVPGLLTPRNVGDVLGILNTTLIIAASADIEIEYQRMLEKAIRECHSAYPEGILESTLSPKYVVFTDSTRYVMDIVNSNPLLRAQLVKGLLRTLRHVKSPLVCAAAVWIISVFSESLAEANDAVAALSCIFKELLDRRKIEKQLLAGSEMQDEDILPAEYYGVTARGAQGERQQPWLREMEELLFVRIGLIRQADGSYDIASSSKSSAGSANGYPHKPSLDPTDNLAFLVESGDALLADFMEKMLSMLKVKAENWNEYE